MNDFRIDNFLFARGGFFREKDLAKIRGTLKKTDDSLFDEIVSFNYKDPKIMLLVSAFFGWFGADRFALGEKGKGLLKLITLGGFGVWYIIDVFKISKDAKRLNFQSLLKIAKNEL